MLFPIVAIAYSGRSPYCGGRLCFVYDTCSASIANSLAWQCYNKRHQHRQSMCTPYPTTLQPSSTPHSSATATPTLPSAASVSACVTCPNPSTRPLSTTSYRRTVVPPALIPQLPPPLHHLAFHTVDVNAVAASAKRRPYRLHLGVRLPLSPPPSPAFTHSLPLFTNPELRQPATPRTAHANHSPLEHSSTRPSAAIRSCLNSFQPSVTPLSAALFLSRYRP